MKHLILLTIAGLVLSHCSKNKSRDINKVEFYLLKNYERVEGKCKVVEATVVLESQPLVSNADIVEYSSSAYEFKLSELAIAKIKALDPRIPFALTVDKSIIYLGMHMPGFISSTCDHSITMTLSYDNPNKLQMRLGYPGISPIAALEDRRNNPTFTAALASQGKLK